jgi:hypothetical protein
VKTEFRFGGEDNEKLHAEDVGRHKRLFVRRRGRDPIARCASRKIRARR